MVSIISGNVKNVVNVARQAVRRNDQPIKKLPLRRPAGVQQNSSLIIFQISTNNCNRSAKFVGANEMKLRSSSSGKYPLDLSMRKMTVSAAAPFSNEATMSNIRVFLDDVGVGANALPTALGFNFLIGDFVKPIGNTRFV